MLSRRRIQLSPEEIAADVRAIRHKAGIDTAVTAGSGIDPAAPGHARPRMGAATRHASKWPLLWPAGAVALGLASLLVIRSDPRREEQITRTYATGTGQQLSVQLIDGTQVTLAPRTTLRLSRFGESLRTVVLDGQAYFTVVHRGTTPFLVRSGATTTRVLGTSFMVQHYAPDAHVRVAVADGKVAVRTLARHADVIVNSGYVGVVDDSTVKVTAVNDLASETDWMRDRLVFRNAPVTEVLATLSRWYGYEFTLTDSSLAQRTMTIALSTRSSAEAFVVLEKVLRVSLAVNGNTVTLTPTHLPRETGRARAKVYDAWTPNREVGR